MNIETKKIISILTLIVLIASIFLPNVSYALEAGKAELKIVPSANEVQRGDEITASIYLNTNSVEPIVAIEAYMYYDPNVLEPVGQPTRDLPVQSSTMFGDVGGAMLDTEKNFVCFLWSSDTVELDYNGSLCTMTFKVKEDATLGNSILEIKGDNPALAGSDFDTNEPIEIPYTVQNADINVIQPVNSISLNKETTELWVNETEKLTVTYDPQDATTQSVTWSSSDNSIATVSPDGTITAVGKGTATITAKTSNGKEDKCEVIVKQPVTGI